MKFVRVICSFLLCVTLCACISAANAQNTSSFSSIHSAMETIMDRFWADSGYSHYEFVRHPAAGLLSVNVSTDGLVQQIQNGNASAAADIRQEFESACKDAISLLNSNGYGSMESRLFFHLINDNMFIRGENAYEAPVLFSIYKGMVIIDETGSFNPSIPQISTEPTYVLNVRSKKFHIPTCDSVERTKPENKADFFGTRDELISTGYDPCGSCNP